MSGIFLVLFRAQKLVFSAMKIPLVPEKPPPTAENGREWERMGRWIGMAVGPWMAVSQRQEGETRS